MNIMTFFGVVVGSCTSNQVSWTRKLTGYGSEHGISSDCWSDSQHFPPLAKFHLWQLAQWFYILLNGIFLGKIPPRYFLDQNLVWFVAGVTTNRPGLGPPPWGTHFGVKTPWLCGSALPCGAGGCLETANGVHQVPPKMAVFHREEKRWFNNGFKVGTLGIWRAIVAWGCSRLVDSPL